jgi:uncharacterized protein YndB with AHSA1/START domain
MHAAVTLHMDASPERVWNLVSDITRMGEYSPEVLEAEWLRGATEPDVGVRYRGHVKRNEVGPTYWTQCEITECVPGEVFEFVVLIGERRVNRWRYEFGASGGGTDVTESFDLGNSLWVKIWRPLGGFLRERRNRRDMLSTLECVRAVAEAPA